MKHILFIAAFISFGLCAAQAQTTREELSANKAKMGGNYYLYPTEFKKQTKAPAGYKPFYISHYGRHGSRFHHTENDVVYLNSTLQKADSANELTALGKSVAKRMQTFADYSHLRAGDLTQKGVAQHRGIALRMFKNFPEVFRDSARVNVFASTSGRCIVSMSAFCGELQGLNPKLKISTESSTRLMSFICYSESDTIGAYTSKPAWSDAYSKLWNESMHPERLIKSIFSDSAYAAKNVDAGKFVHNLYFITESLQGLDTAIVNFNDVWTDDELFGNWAVQNAWWYGAYGTSPLTEMRGSKFAKNLLKNIIDEADKAIAGDGTRATLRFGHDTGILPLVSLMKVEGADAQVTDLTELYKSWADFKIIPMAANLQLVFYKSAKKGNPVLVKVLFNENEVKLPITCGANEKCPAAPYYDWDKFKEFYGSTALR